ncbi:DUF262 domain-containing protein [Sulfitobacter pontiacus]|uniref:DUF262 domain-containing protein n=1 Tax=Sulfitobacter pontiacus TaxID=60137 RepID=UPI0021A8D313|nr:DUF262 domain-containing protein [Sulfitobacter pontiacus]UWR17532.1 DUF262 domain-containing protein [Sulfitobacter pontiacus]
MLEQYRIADFIEWNREKKLKLNPDFQRGSVWVPSAKVFLVDTILRGLPVPKIYLRTTIDTERQQSVREVVDGQQRLRAILDFASDKFRLSNRAKEFKGLTYSSLDPEQKAAFLEYPLAVEQLLNASEDEVLEVFARLNSYTVSLNPAEKRHASFQGHFKWLVRDKAREWSTLWNDFGFLTTRQRVRMEDDVTMAQFLMIADTGVTEGGANRIEKFYKANDAEFDGATAVVKKVDDTLNFIVANIAPAIQNTRLATAPQLITIFAAVAHRLFGIPAGSVEGDFPPGEVGIPDLEVMQDNLVILAAALEAESPPDRLASFVTRSLSSTQTVASRQVRFRTFYAALGDQAI